MAKSDRDISEWDARLRSQLQRAFHNYHCRRIDLSVARDNQKLDWTGEILIVENVSSLDASAKVRLNFDDADQLTLEEDVEIESIFGGLFISNDAQPDEWLDVIAGINFKYRQQAQSRAEAQSCKIITNVAADANTVGTANVCNKVLIRAFTTNTGLVWVDFHQAAVENLCYPLAKGDAISNNLRNTDQINALFKVAGESVAVVFEV